MEIEKNEEIVATKSRFNKIYWGIFLAYLAAVLIVQFAFIWKLQTQVDFLNNELEESYDKCSSSVHKINKRYTSLYCPPGCVRRRRRKGLLGAAGRQEATNQIPVSYYGTAGQPGDRGWPGQPGESGEPGLAGAPGGQGSPGAAGQPGSRGLSGGPGQQGSPGLPGGQGSPGSPGLPGGMGAQGQPGSAGAPGSAGSPGLRGPPGGMGSPGERGSPGGRGPSGSAGMPGAPGERGASGGQGSAGEPGSQGARGPSGSRGHPGSIGTSYNHHYGYNYNTETDTMTVETTSSPVVKSGHTRGDQGVPTFDPNFPLVPTPRKNETQMNEVLKELRLLDHPECKDDFDHQTLLNQFKEKGRVSFMILVDLQDSVYCIVHGKHGS